MRLKILLLVLALCAIAMPVSAHSYDLTGVDVKPKDAYIDNLLSYQLPLLYPLYLTASDGKKHFWLVASEIPLTFKIVNNQLEITADKDFSYMRKATVYGSSTFNNQVRRNDTTQKWYATSEDYVAFFRDPPGESFRLGGVKKVEEIPQAIRKEVGGLLFPALILFAILLAVGLVTRFPFWFLRSKR